MDTIKVHYAGSRLRGFHRHLISDSPEKVEYDYAINESGFYEIKSGFSKLLSKVWHSRLGDYLGLIQTIRVSGNYDLVQTFNRFCRTKNPYLIYLENPTAVFHYEIRRIHTFLGKRNITKKLYSNNLRGIICMSKICLETVKKVIPGFPEHVFLDQIYPYIPTNPLVTRKQILNKVRSRQITGLFISSDFVLKGGRELINALDLLLRSGYDKINFILVTRISSIPSEYRKKIERYSKYIKVKEFSLTPSEMTQLYAIADFLIHPTLKDSFGLVILEALKAGLPVISTNLYAIPEMIIDGYNGYLFEPPIRYFFANGMPNPGVWRQDRLLVKEGPYDEISYFIADKTTAWLDNKDKLVKMSLAAWEQAITGEFSTEFIKNKWFDVYSRALKKT